MDKNFLQKNLGMVIYLLDYHYEKLNKPNTFADDYCDTIKNICDSNDLLDMEKALAFAIINQEDCLKILFSPLKSKFSDEEIVLFFNKFYEFLKKCNNR